GSKEYKDAVDLRYRVLRIPLGLEFDPAVLALEYNDHHLCAYSDDNQLLGCLLMSPYKNGSVKMRQFAVEPEFQGKGIGKSLISFAEQWAVQNHFTRIELHARLTAVPFYLKLGYETEGEEFIEVTIPHRFMWKVL